MADFNKPSSSSLRSAFMQEITDMFKDIGKMFNGTTTSNYPTGCIRLNATTHKFETYNGATWDVLDLTGLNVGSVLAKVPAAASGLATLNASSKVLQTALTAEACTGNAATATSTTNAAGTGTAVYSAETGLRILRGSLNGDRTIAAGAGFSANSGGGTGQYNVYNITPPFSGRFSCSANKWGGGEVGVFYQSTNQVIFVDYNSSGTAVNDSVGIDFICIGPK